MLTSFHFLRVKLQGFHTFFTNFPSFFFINLFQKQIPEEGWPDHALELFLSWLACHDTNNRVDITTVGAGEREGRVVCSLVRRLHCK
ncbi:hypothetical protein ANCCAN_24069 [Ancylostoma caninum]|uniref:Uncharacterized protein n=1 Tax=Ancylostoma caninum TaxID=29170 RepID=A0A368FDF0_ANCCA|nr:hypothetical protein ANCCAN_24069 [Ancylostoma caninum]